MSGTIARMEYEKKSGYGKRLLWQWVALYVVLAAVVYGLVYYFFLGGAY